MSIEVEIAASTFNLTPEIPLTKMPSFPGYVAQLVRAQHS